MATGCVPEYAPAPGACDNLINNVTIFRATASFMRTVVTRNTPWDRFLAGENGALTLRRSVAPIVLHVRAERWRRCYTCHSGPC